MPACVAEELFLGEVDEESSDFVCYGTEVLEM